VEQEENHEKGPRWSWTRNQMGNVSQFVMKKLTSKSLRFIPAALGLVFCLLANPAGAAIQYWDNNGTSAVTGGNWDTTSTFWAPSSTLTASTAAFVNGTFAEFSAGTTPSILAINVPGPVTCAGMATRTTGSTVTLSGTGPITISSGMQGFYCAGQLVINPPLTGVGGVEQEGDGNLALYGNNTYSGGTEITGGQILYYNQNSSFGASSGGITINGTGGALVSSATTNVTIANNFVFPTTGYTVNLVGGTAGTIFSGNFPLPSGTTTIYTSSTAGQWAEISGVVSGSGAALTVADFGTLVLANANTYTGNTTVSGGTLQLMTSGSIASTNIIVAGGAAFDVTLLRNTNTVVSFTNIYLLASYQTLSNSSSTAILAGSINSGSGTISLTYASNTPSFLCTRAGTLTLSQSTTFKVNNTGSPLGPGTYTLINSTNVNTGIVAGAVPSVTVSDGGVTSGATSSLSISNGALFLVVASAAHAPVIGNNVTNTVTSGDMWQIAISSLSNSAAWSGPNSDTLILSSVGPSSTNSVSVTNDANNIYYTVPVTAPDNFRYIVTDETTSLMATGMVYLAVTPAVSPIISGSAVTVNGSGNPTFSGTGASDNTVYGVESTISLSVPVVWIEAGTTTTGPTGSFSFTDINKTNPPTIFYRLYNPDDPSSPPQ
jgi:autotransporter-associated beta strand protein